MRAIFKWYIDNRRVTIPLTIDALKWLYSKRKWMKKIWINGVKKIKCRKGNRKPDEVPDKDQNILPEN